MRWPQQIFYLSAMPFDPFRQSDSCQKCTSVVDISHISRKHRAYVRGAKLSLFEILESGETDIGKQMSQK
jgi:hypothetical protein